jgi:bifunctional ADP-heptose synthase (sugar kinase/adenylyltransferase)
MNEYVSKPIRESELAVALERGHSLEESVPYANKAAGIVVGRFGTTTVSEEEVFGTG